MPTLRESGPNISVLNLPPVFNKRLFKAQAGIVLTDDTLEILRRRSTARRSAEELHVIKPVVAALKEIHKGLQFIKEALCHVVTYQKIEAGVEISKQQGESCLSCYYILSGSVEAKYDINNGSSGDPAAAEKSYDCEITYTHVAGEYLGLVSGDGREFESFHEAWKSLNSCESTVTDFTAPLSEFRIAMFKKLICLLRKSPL